MTLAQVLLSVILRMPTLQVLPRQAKPAVLTAMGEALCSTTATVQQLGISGLAPEQ